MAQRTGDAPRLLQQMLLVGARAAPKFFRAYPPSGAAYPF